MKKAIIIFIAFIFCFQLASNAQKARVGIQAGITTASISRTIDGLDQDGEYRIGISGGMIVDLPFGKKQQWSFQPSLEYVQKGATEESKAPIRDTYTALRYAELTPRIVRNFKAGKAKTSTFYLGAGPYLALPFPSKKVEHIPGSDDIETDINFGNVSASTMRGVDFGGTVLMGYRMANGIYVALNYSQGARNLAPQDNGDKIKNIAFGIRIGYLFKAAADK